MKFGTLTFTPVMQNLDLLAAPTQGLLRNMDTSDVLVSQIDESLSDTASFCEHYQIGVEQGANCVIVQAKRGEKVWYAACMILGVDRIDVNSAVRKHLGAKKISFAPIDTATSLTSMEYGAITPFGLPEDWPILVDSAVVKAGNVIVGGGVRGSKLLVSGAVLAALPQAEVIDIAVGS